jgi:hypothetical protein
MELTDPQPPLASHGDQLPSGGVNPDDEELAESGAGRHDSARLGTHGCPDMASSDDEEDPGSQMGVTELSVVG